MGIYYGRLVNRVVHGTILTWKQFHFSLKFYWKVLFLISGIIIMRMFPRETVAFAKSLKEKKDVPMQKPEINSLIFFSLSPLPLHGFLNPLATAMLLLKSVCVVWL